MSRRVVGMLALAVVVAGCGGSGEALLPEGRALAAAPTLAPAVHLFGDPVVARLDVVVDRRLLDPDRLEARGDFAPYERVGPPRRSRRDAASLHAPAVRVHAPLPRAPVREPRARGLAGDRAGRKADVPFPGGAAALRGTAAAAGHVAAARGRLPDQHRADRRQVSVPFRASTTPLPEPTYRAAPPVVAGGLLLAALALLTVPARAGWRLRRARRPPPAAEVVPRETALQRALSLIEEASDSDEPARRRALQLLADEDERSDAAELAEHATEASPGRGRRRRRRRLRRWSNGCGRWMAARSELRRGIPVAEPAALRRPLRRTALLRVALGLALIGAFAAAFAVARNADVRPTSLLPGDTALVVVLDLSASISNFPRVAEALRRVARERQQAGLVAFSSGAYELLPPETPAHEVEPFVRFFTPLRRGGTVYPRNPWDAARFRGGTSVPAGLETARYALRRAPAERRSILLISDLDSAGLPATGHERGGPRAPAGRGRARIVPVDASPEGPRVLRAPRRSRLARCRNGIGPRRRGARRAAAGRHAAVGVPARGGRADAHPDGERAAPRPAGHPRVSRRDVIASLLATTAAVVLLAAAADVVAAWRSLARDDFRFETASSRPRSLWDDPGALPGAAHCPRARAGG